MTDPSRNSVVVGTAGHVDHGKSTLIGSLLLDSNSLPEGKLEEIKAVCESLGKDLQLGYIMDSFEEERDQNVTIDTTQTFFKTKKQNYTIIDAPGHVEFIKNMITGASQADVAILLIDVDEGIKEQTLMHAYILKLLGIEKIIFAINKMDIVNYSESKYMKLRRELLNLLYDLNLPVMTIIPISAMNGDFVVNKSGKMAWYAGHSLIDHLDNLTIHEPLIDKPLRFSVQDVYNFDKRIIVGRVEVGRLNIGDKIAVLPSGEETEVLTIEEYLNNDIKTALPGKCVGITTKDKLFIERGDIISDIIYKPLIRKEFYANIFWMDKEPIKKGDRITFKCSTQERVCEIKEFVEIIDVSTLKIIKRDELRNREVAKVLIKTDKPVVVEYFYETPELGRFVLEKMNVCAGGIIIDII